MHMRVSRDTSGRVTILQGPNVPMLFAIFVCTKQGKKRMQYCAGCVTKTGHKLTGARVAGGASRRDLQRVLDFIESGMPPTLEPAGNLEVRD